jgi:hypothetical protein
MFRVRFYDRVFIPQSLTGRLGRVIRAINWVRWKLEVVVQRLMVTYLADEAALLPEERKSVLAQFQVDVMEEKLQSIKVAAPDPRPLISRGDKYGVASITTALAEASGQPELPSRPQPAGEMIARYMNPKLVRYAKGRRFTVVHDVEDFEPVEK